MKKTIWAVYFSPADGTRKITVFLAKWIADALGGYQKEIDFTKKENRARTYTFSADDVVIFGSPVYAGRIPNKILPDWQQCFLGNGACAIPVCTFGNRNFDGALDEFHLLLQQNGFCVTAKAAIACQHVFSDLVGTGRPDAADWADIQSFADRIAAKLSDCESESETANAPASAMLLPDDTVIPPYYTPLKADGTPAKFLKAKPLTNANCTDCGACAAACPMGSIDAKNPREVTGVCIKCQACVLKCPAHAKYFADEEFLSHVKMLEEHYHSRTKSVYLTR